MKATMKSYSTKWFKIQIRKPEKKKKKVPHNVNKKKNWNLIDKIMRLIDK